MEKKQEREKEECYNSILKEGGETVTQSDSWTRLKEYKVIGHVGIQRKNFPDRGSSMCKGHEARACLRWPRNGKVTMVTVVKY